MALPPREVPVPAAPQGRILLVEDDRVLRGVVEGVLQAAGHEVTVAVDGVTAARLAGVGGFDVVLLDIGLPVADGWHVLDGLGGRRVPAVIVISARGEERDKVRALDMGADDYLAKPFGADELLARVRAVLRRVQVPVEASKRVACDGVVVDLGARAVARDGVEVRLSPTEYLLLAELARHAGTVLDHRTLLERVWGPGYADERNYLRTFVQRLRLKLERDPANPVIIETVGRLGYRFGRMLDA